MKKVYSLRIVFYIYLLMMIGYPILSYLRDILMSSNEFNLFGYVQSIFAMYLVANVFFFGTKSNQYILLTEKKIQLKSFRKVIKEISIENIDDIVIQKRSLDYLIIIDKSNDIEIKTIRNNDILKYILRYTTIDELTTKIEELVH